MKDGYLTATGVTGGWLGWADMPPVMKEIVNKGHKDTVQVAIFLCNCGNLGAQRYNEGLPPGWRNDHECYLCNKGLTGVEAGSKDEVEDDLPKVYYLSS